MELLAAYLNTRRMTGLTYKPHTYRLKSGQEVHVSWSIPDQPQIDGLNNLLLAYIQRDEIIKRVLQQGIPLFA
jgi:hypothetical protein